MNATTIAIGTVAVIISLVCWGIFFRGIWQMVSAIAQGQRVDRTRFWPFFPRLWTLIKEFGAHTRMVKSRTVGWAHWLVMIGFLLGFIFVFEAYGQVFNPEFHWPWLGTWGPYVLAEEILGWGTVIGIIPLIIIRQLNHPRLPQRLSRFSGSRFGAAYFVEIVVLIEGLGMLGVKLLKITSGIEHAPLWQAPTLHPIAEWIGIGSTPTWSVSVFAFLKLMSAMIWVAVVGSNIDWGVAWHRFAAFPNIYFKREANGGVALGAAKPMMSNGRVLDMESADPDVDAFGAGKVEDFSWKGWLDFTTCTECGRCQSQCPAWNTGKPLSPKLLIMSLRDHAQAKAPYLIAGGKKDMGGDEVGLVDADGNVLEDKLNAIPAAARAEAGRRLVGESAGSGTIEDGELGAVIDTETLWSCTTCGACVEQCPVDIEHVDHIIDMRRYQVLIESDFPTELAGMFKNLENKGNPWGQNSSARTNWIDEMDIEIPVFGQDVESFEGFEYLFWVGCAGAYEDRAKKTTKAVAELLDIAAVNFLVLGEGETCTGDSARRAGNEFLFQMLAQQNIEMIGEVFATAPTQRKKVVVTCAHCFNALGNEYPQLGAKYEVVHHTQLLNRLVREKRLVPVAPLGEGVTYHDPCYLGRHNKVYDAPRELMGASGSVLTEMPRHGERSMCCGAGGARMWMEEQIGKRINLDRVDEALDTLGDITGDQVKKVATGCPFCRVMLTDGVTARTSGTEAEGKVEVVDVAQLLLESVKRGAPEVERGGRFLGPIAKPASEPVPAVAAAAAAAPAATAAPATTSSESSAAPKPKVGLGMKGGMKKPGASAKAGTSTAPPETSTAPSEASTAPESTTTAPEKKPAAKGFGMKGGMKKPGASATASTAPSASSTAPSEASTAPDSTTTAPEKKPAAKGFGMKGGMKKPGAAAKAPTSTAPADTSTAPSEASTAPESTTTAPSEASTAPESTTTAPSEASTAPESTTTAPEKKPAAKGFGMKGGIKKPGAAAKAPASAAPVAETAPPAEAAPAEPTADDESSIAGEAPAQAVADAGAAATEEKPGKAKGFGMSAGKKRPGGIGKATPKPAPASTAPSEAPSEPSDASTAPEPTSTAPSEATTAPETASSEPEETSPEPMVKRSASAVTPSVTPHVEPAISDETPADEAPAESAVESAPEPTSNGSARTIGETGASKAKGFGMAAGKKRPGHS